MPNDLDLLMDAARSAGDIAKHYFNASPEVWEKSDGQGPVTEADLHVNRQLEADLRAARPEYGWLSEETEDNSARQTADRVFIIDPIDGTRSFIEGHKDWSHSLAIAENGKVTSAVVYVPMRDAIYAAAVGHGATKNGAALTTAKTTTLTDATILTTRANLQAKHWAGGKAPEFKHTFRSSLAYRLALVAEGRFDAMITFRPTWEWDVAAGSLIVEEARGTASDQAGQTPVFNNVHPQINGMVAAGAVHPALLGALARPALP